MPDQFIDVPIQVDENVIYNNAITQIQAGFPNWTPRRNSFIDIVLRTCASMAAIGATIESEVAFDIFAAFGPLVNIPINPATSAQTTTTWTLAASFPNTVDYDIPDGTPVGLASASQVDPIGFAVQGDWTIPAGSTSVAGVSIVASDPGADGSGLDQVIRVDSLNYIGSITADAASFGGNDAELTSDFVNRLTKELEVWTPTPILGKDFALIAQLLVPGVFRCGFLDNYNPADNTFGNEKMVTICPIDEMGAAVSGTVQAACTTLLESLREWNFICNVIGPVRTTVNVEYQAFVNDSSLFTQGQADVNAAIAAYLNPGTWGNPNTGSGLVPLWTDNPNIRKNKLVQAIESPLEINYTNNVEMDIGAGFVSTDIVLPGPFSLPVLGTITPTMTVGT